MRRVVGKPTPKHGKGRGRCQRGIEGSKAWWPISLTHTLPSILQCQEKNKCQRESDWIENLSRGCAGSRKPGSYSACCPSPIVSRRTGKAKTYASQKAVCIRERLPN
eukprot:74244-Pelagomonas_calceolata.AAC.5